MERFVICSMKVPLALNTVWVLNDRAWETWGWWGSTKKKSLCSAAVVLNCLVTTALKPHDKYLSHLSLCCFTKHREHRLCYSEPGNNHMFYFINCYGRKLKLLIQNPSPHCFATKIQNRIKLRANLIVFMGCILWQTSKCFFFFFKSARKAVTSGEKIIIFMSLIHLTYTAHLGNISPMVIRLKV